jgi:hypothetical protein
VRLRGRRCGSDERGTDVWTLTDGDLGVALLLCNRQVTHVLAAAMVSAIGEPTEGSLSWLNGRLHVAAGGPHARVCPRPQSWA